MSQWTWYLSRSAGITAWVLLIFSAVIGAALPAGWFQRWPRSVRTGLHRWVSSLAVVATAMHLIALVLDQYVDFPVRSLFLPFASTWRPGPVAAGVVALWLLLLVTFTSAIRRRISMRLWRSVHLLSYALCLFATLHAVTSGTDIEHTGAPLLVGGAAVVLISATALLRAWAPTARETRTANQQAPRKDHGPARVR